MISFEQFVERLGDFAKQYTQEQLHQLHVDVKRFAQIIIAINRTREKRLRFRSPQPALDAADVDRTLE
jgi:CHAD domain-containing protein